MANTKISQLTALTNPTGNEELVYAYNNANGKMALNTMKTFANTGQQPELVSGTNIKTINGESILWSWNLVVQGGWGWTEAAYDAIVDASGDGDYTLVSAAIAAGKYNIFVKNGSYTETAWRDPYSNNAAYLHIVWESESGVHITMPSTITTNHGYMIDMRYNWDADFYMENITFTITLTSTNSVFYSDAGGENLIVKNCTFNYTTNVVWAGSSDLWLFETSIVATSKNWAECWRVYSGLYGCNFATDTTEIINILWGLLPYENCKFSSTSWRIQLTQWNDKAKLYNCYADVYELGGLKKLELFNSYILVNWNVYDNDWYKVGIERMESSLFKVGTLQNTPTAIELWECTDSEIDFWTYDVTGWILFNSMESIQSNCRIKCGNLYVGNNMNWCYVSATWLTFVQYSRIIWCNFTNSLTSVTLNKNDCILMWNRFAWTSWSIAISWDYNVITSNVMPNFSISDSWTGNQKANNITA